MLRLCYARDAKPTVHDEAVVAAADVSRRWLRETVETIAIPRHFEHQAEENRSIGRWLKQQFEALGFAPRFHGESRNLIVGPRRTGDPLVLVGAHYDSVPTTPGADDNASAVAAMLACAGAVARHGGPHNVAFVAFNREEDGLTGSREFVADFLPGSGWKVHESHVLEMVGYCDHSPGSQRVPRGLPIRVRDVGDFLAVLGNRISLDVVDRLLSSADCYESGFPVIGLKIYWGLERQIRHFVRSDHAPLWEAGVPALMWTDTSEFRNPHYHQRTDLPSTLDYDFLQRVTQLLSAHVIQTAAGLTGK